MEFETAGERIISDHYRTESDTAAYISEKLGWSFGVSLEYLKIRRRTGDHKIFFWVWWEGQYYYKNDNVERYIRREQRVQRKIHKAMIIRRMNLMEIKQKEVTEATKILGDDHDNH